MGTLLLHAEPHLVTYWSISLDDRCIYRNQQNAGSITSAVISHYDGFDAWGNAIQLMKPLFRWPISATPENGKHGYLEYPSTWATLHSAQRVFIIPSPRKIDVDVIANYKPVVRT